MTRCASLDNSICTTGVDEEEYAGEYRYREPKLLRFGAEKPTEHGF
jgi:hypothetical protein